MPNKIGTSNKIYCGIGEPSTPDNILNLMSFISRRLYDLGYTLHTRYSATADLLFQINARDKFELFFPFPHYKGFGLEPALDSRIQTSTAESLLEGNIPTKEAFVLARSLFEEYSDKEWDNFRFYLGRNVHLILGKNLDNPIDFLVCWSSDGIEICDDVKTAIRDLDFLGLLYIANVYSVPVINLKKDDALTRIGIMVNGF